MFLPSRPIPMKANTSCGSDLRDPQTFPPRINVKMILTPLVLHLILNKFSLDFFSQGDSELESWLCAKHPAQILTGEEDLRQRLTLRNLGNILIHSVGMFPAIGTARVLVENRFGRPANWSYDVR